MFKAQDKKRDQFLPTLHDLAGSFAHGFREIDPSKIFKAQQVEKLEALADQQGFAGKFDAMEETQKAAAKLRVGLAGSIKSDDVDQGKALLDTLRDVKDAMIDLNKFKVVVKEVGK